MTTSQAVSYLIGRKPFIAEALNDEIINFSALAEHLKPEIESLLGKKVKAGAIVMALRRFEFAQSITFSKKLDNLISRIGDIVVRSNLADYTFRNSDSLQQKQRKLFDTIQNQQEFFCTISQGVYETTFVLSEVIKEEVPKIFEGEKLISHGSGLASITIKLPTDNTEQPGVYYFIFRKLAWEGINIKEVVSTSNEFTILLHDDDVDRAFSVIKQIKK